MVPLKSDAGFLACRFENADTLRNHFLTDAVAGYQRYPILQCALPFEPVFELCMMCVHCYRVAR